MPLFRVGKPRWRLQRSVNQVLPAGENLLEWDVVVFDDPGLFQGLNDILLDRDGLWLVGVAVNRAAVAVASGVTVRSWRNGVNQQLCSSAPSLGVICLQVVSMLEADEGDVLSATATLHPSLPATLTAGNTIFWGTRIGPKRWV